MIWLLLIYCFILGSCIGSFCNVYIDRYITNQKLNLRERSCCDTCKTSLCFLDLLPILGYLLLKGKCRYCGSKLVLSYLFIEIFYGLVFCFFSYYYLLFYLNSSNITIIFTLFCYLVSIILFSVCYCVYCIDIKIMEIPDIVHIIYIFLGLINILILKNITLIEGVFGFLIISVFLYILSCIISDCFGGGDIKLFACAGFFLGWKLTLLTFFLSLVFTLIYILLKKKSFNNKVSFGPFISLSIFFSYFLGTDLISLYLNIFKI